MVRGERKCETALLDTTQERGKKRLGYRAVVVINSPSVLERILMSIHEFNLDCPSEARG